ncbi:hypothetical protein Ancab_000346 [Ancistrocladus abbreviatus]
MNPPPIIPNSYFSFNGLNPNPNAIPNSNIFRSHSQLSSPQLQSQTPVSDVSTTLSLLNNLIQLSCSTLEYVSSLLPVASKSEQKISTSSAGLCRCLSNPNHLMPPECLFLHSLRCPSPLDIGSLLDNLHYLKTLKSENQLNQENKFVQSLADPNTELCFSLEEYGDFGSNFFYQDCPGVVSSLSRDNRRMFLLPGALAIECANFANYSDREIRRLQTDCLKLLPSELWVVRCEIEQWNDYPNTYSHSILRVFMGLERVKECDLLVWLISNSPRFGVVIDVAMRDHIYVLFRLCLKAVIKEALCSFESLFKRGLAQDSGELNPKQLNFKCPILADAFKWLKSQLSILYGEVNANSLCMGILKHSLLNVASSSLLWSLGYEMASTSVNELDSNNSDTKFNIGQSLWKIVDAEVHDEADGGIFSRAIFVYQVGAAIAALHERSLLEERLRSLRNIQTLTPYQRATEHAYWSKRADEERQKHPSYRPLLEHDGLPSEHPYDHETSNRAKTREELLAEERDYKRRRMSYRGKKLKRTTKEVMRDIIEEHMEAIRQAGGIGCFGRGDKTGGKSFHHHGHATDIELKEGTSEGYETRRDQQHGDKEQLHSDYDVRLIRLEDVSHDRFEGPTQASCKYDEHLEYRRTKRVRREETYHSRTLDKGGSHRSSREHRSPSHGLSTDRKNRRNVNEIAEPRLYRSNCHSPDTSNHHSHGSCSSISRSTSVSSGRKDKHRQKRHGNDRSESLKGDGFEDRYDPSKSNEMYGEEFV